MLHADIVWGVEQYKGSCLSTFKVLCWVESIFDFIYLEFRYYVSTVRHEALNKNGNTLKMAEKRGKQHHDSWLHVEECGGKWVVTRVNKIKIFKYSNCYFKFFFYLISENLL